MLLIQEGDIYQFHYTGKENMENDADYLTIVKILANDISRDVFSGAGVNIHLCHEFFYALKVVENVNH